MSNNIVVVEDTLNEDKRIAVDLIHELGQGSLSPERIRDLWLCFSRHDVLFSDQTMGDFEAFFDILVDPKSIWFELVDVDSRMVLGVMSSSRVIPGFDAYGHFAIWNGRARGKEKAILKTMQWVFNRYDLHRMTAHIPAYQSGVIRFVDRLGFSYEGELREAVQKDGTWVGMKVYGITVDDLEEALNG